MIDFQQFHFLRPYCLLACIPLVVLLWFMLRKKLSSRSWESVCDESLLPHMLIGSAGRTRTLSVLLTAICGLISIIALAGPVWEKLPQPVFSNEGALVIALDLSRSMDADDITPSRVARARFKIEDILKQREEGQTALLVYAGDAFTVSPLTDDIATIISQLKALSTDIMPVPGNRTEAALKHAVDLLKQAGASSGDVLLLSDEVDYENSRKTAEGLKRAGYRLSIIGVGTESGVPVPLADGSFLKDSAGQIVIPGLEEEPMRQLAQSGAGLYVKMSAGDEDIDTLKQLFTVRLGEDDISATELETDIWLERGPWLLLLLVPFLLLTFRRGYLVLLVVFILPMPEQAQAFEWKDLWQRPDQQAREILDQGGAERAAELFKDPSWKAAAQYRAGDYTGAETSLQQVDNMEAQYNRGNALARQGRYEEAIAEYEKVLEKNSEHEDAKYNKELLEEQLKQQQQQDNQDQQNEQEQNEDEQQNDQQQQNKGDSEQQQGDNQQEQQQQSDPEQQQEQDSEQQNQQETEQQQDNDGEEQSEQQSEEQQQQEEKEQQSEQAMASEQQTPDEEQQATEQWLRRIPDDPAGLLRRKFRYQYQQRQGQTDPNEKTW